MAVTRRTFLGTLAGGLLAAPRATEAQPAGKVYRIGYLSEFAEASSPWNIRPFVEGLRELGWVEGQNIVIERRYADGQADRLPALATELAQLKVDVVVTNFERGTKAAQRAAPNVPIVMTAGVDPIGSGLITSLARPGGNVTGLILEVVPESWGWNNRMGLVKEAVPHASRVAVLATRFVGADVAAAWLEGAKSAAGKMGITLEYFEIGAPSDLDTAFASIRKERIGAILSFVNPAHAGRRIIDFAARNRLPALYGARASVDAGGLMSWGPRIPDQLHRAAAYVDRILRGAKPADLPVEQPTKFELVINMKTAKALGLTIPPSVLARADEIIE